MQPLAPDDKEMMDAVVAQLGGFIEAYPYLEPGSTIKPHILQHSVARCRDCLRARRFVEAQEYIRRIQAGLDSDVKQVAEAFKRFDTDNSGFLDLDECKHMCAYLGWGDEEAVHIMENADVNGDGKVSIEEFQSLVGRAGGVQRLFDRRRQRINLARRDVCDAAGISVGDRVRTHFWVRGQKSRSWREAQVLKVDAQDTERDPPLRGLLVEFGFGEAPEGEQAQGASWRARQIVPPTWVLSGVDDAAVVTALREVGILDEQQAFWSLLYPDSEMRAIERLEACQRAALAHTRSHCTHSHDQALPKLRERFEKLGFGPREVQAVLSWVQDLAPVVVHVHLDRMGQFLETDEFYRNQFETKTSCGALDPENNTRKRWEHELFGGTYDEAKPFERCKYGALNILNDYRGVVRARGYGDSYLVLKDVRLRCTFASTDSGGLKGSRLAVLDKYAHVLSEYNDQELRAITGIAMAAIFTPPGEHQAGVQALAPSASVPQLLRGPTEDPCMDWITMGFPILQQAKGRWYFEVELLKGVCAPQVGLLSKSFKIEPRAPSGQGVGDDAHGWACDGTSAALWHNGVTRAWKTVWKAETPTTGRFIFGGGANAGEELSDTVFVGVAVDLDRRMIWFSSDNNWDAQPDFDSKEFPKGVAVYPAVSLKGRAAFHFGPTFKLGPPKQGDKPFEQWPGAVSGHVRVDSPILGNEELLSIYKEVQIHGEVSLKKHVQRLVACNKYRDQPKTQRNWSVKVTGAGASSGTYRRVGAHNDLPLYRNEGGALIYAQPDAGQWRLADTGDFSQWHFTAPYERHHDRPPHRGWDLPDVDRGILDLDIFGVALEEAEVGAAAVTQLVEALCVKDAAGKSVVYRVLRQKDVSLEKEWKRLKITECTAAEAWELGVQEVQQRLLKDAGLEQGCVVETEHPYEAKRLAWKQEVELEDAANLQVLFSRRSCTKDSRSRFNIYSSGLRREASGIGSRVEVTVPGGDKVWGTVLKRSKNLDDYDASWKVVLDRHPPEEATDAGGEAPPPPEEAAWPQVGDLVEGKYKTGVWHKATVKEVRADGTYLLDWYDGLNRDREKKKDKLRRPGAAEAPGERFLEALPRYGAVPQSATTECWANCREEPESITVAYGPEEWVAAGEKARGEAAGEPTVGDEIVWFALDRTCPLTPISIQRISSEGPASAKGVEAGWYLDIVATFSGPSSKQLREVLQGFGPDGQDPPHEPQALLDACFANLLELQRRLNERLRTMTKVTLVFTDSSSPSPVQMLPEAVVSYGKELKIGDEIQELTVSDKKVIVKTMEKAGGPAHTAGVRSDWEVDLQQTLRLNEKLLTSSGEEAEVSEEKVVADPKCLLALKGWTVVFTQPNPAAVLKFSVSGPRGGTDESRKGAEAEDPWKACTLPGSHAEFEFTTDGDTAGVPSAERWGVWALILPKDQKPPSQAEVDKLAEKWVEATSRAQGCQDEMVIQRNDWDEARLKALCARHGWEFSWMTEDGERRRRAHEKFDASMSTWNHSRIQPMERDGAVPDGQISLRNLLTKKPTPITSI